MALLTYLIEYSRFILHDRSVLFMPIFYLYYPTRENYDVFYHGWENYGRGKYGGTSQKPPNFDRLHALLVVVNDVGSIYRVRREQS